MNKHSKIEELEADNERLRRLDAEYGMVESHIIMSDREFDGDSDHESPGYRLMASIDRLRTKADTYDLINSTEPASEAHEKLMQGYGIGTLIKWANDPATEWKSHRARDRFIRHLHRAYAQFKMEVT